MFFCFCTMLVWYDMIRIFGLLYLYTCIYNTYYITVTFFDHNCCFLNISVYYSILFLDLFCSYIGVIVLTECKRMHYRHSLCRGKTKGPCHRKCGQFDTAVSASLRLSRMASGSKRLMNSSHVGLSWAVRAHHHGDTD